MHNIINRRLTKIGITLYNITSWNFINKNKKMNKKIRVAIISLIIVVSLVVIGIFFRKMLTTPENDLAVAPKTAQELAEEERKIEQTIKKLQEGFFQALHGRVVEIDRNAGIMKVETYQPDEPVIMEVSFNNRTTDVVKVNAVISENEESAQSEEDEAGDFSYEESSEKSNLDAIEKDSMVQVETGDFFKLNPGEKIKASRITIFEEVRN